MSVCCEEIRAREACLREADAGLAKPGEPVERARVHKPGCICVDAQALQPGLAGGKQARYNGGTGSVVWSRKGQVQISEDRKRYHGLPQIRDGLNDTLV